MHISSVFSIFIELTVLRYCELFLDIVVELNVTADELLM